MKKIIAVLLSIAMISGCLVVGAQAGVTSTDTTSTDVTFTDVTPTNTPSNVESLYTLGDPNGNGKFDAGDALLILQFAVAKQTMTPGQVTASDVNLDQKVNAADALLILIRAVGKISTFYGETKELEFVHKSFDAPFTPPEGDELGVLVAKAFCCKASYNLSNMAHIYMNEFTEEQIDAFLSEHSPIPQNIYRVYFYYSHGANQEGYRVTGVSAKDATTLVVEIDYTHGEVTATDVAPMWNYVEFPINMVTKVEFHITENSITKDENGEDQVETIRYSETVPCDVPPTYVAPPPPIDMDLVNQIAWPIHGGLDVENSRTPLVYLCREDEDFQFAMAFHHGMEADTATMLSRYYNREWFKSNDMLLFAFFAPGTSYEMSVLNVTVNGTVLQVELAINNQGPGADVVGEYMYHYEMGNCSEEINDVEYLIYYNGAETPVTVDWEFSVAVPE